MLVDNNKVGDIVRPTRVHKLLVLVSASVQSLAVWKYQPQLLGKLLQFRGRIPGGCDDDLGILHSRPSVLIILTIGNCATTRSPKSKSQLWPRVIPGTGLG